PHRARRPLRDGRLPAHRLREPAGGPAGRPPPHRPDPRHPGRLSSRDLRLALVGFGNVGRRFGELLDGPYRRVLAEAGVRPRVTGIATARHGIAVDAGGLPTRRAARLAAEGRPLAVLNQGAPLASVVEFIRRVPADVLLELTPLNPRTGQPATAHVRQALRRGLHVV